MSKEKDNSEANSVLADFRWRGMVHSHTPNLDEVIAKALLRAYIGFDPTADSLHVGSLLPLMSLARLQRYGHTPIAIAGGATGRIGDPSGKAQERPLLTDEQVEANLLGIKEQLGHILDFSVKANPAIILNNADWLGGELLIDFLRDVGKFFTVNYMLDKESVRRRMALEDAADASNGDPESETTSSNGPGPGLAPKDFGRNSNKDTSKEGISFTEFAYMLLQSYDFLVLYDRYGCLLQMGGSDQWGNITAGIDLIRKRRGVNAHGLVFPLVTTATGVKFGKTEEGTVWLSPKLTSPYKFYQFWLNTDDRDVARYLKFFTWLPRNDIEVLEHSVAEHPERREAQLALAREVTRLVHGVYELSKAERASQVLFGGELRGLHAADIMQVFENVPYSRVSKLVLAGDGVSLIDLLVSCGLVSSRNEGRRLVQSGGIYLNNEQIANLQHQVTLDDSVEGACIVLRRGQKQYHVVQIT